MIALSAFIENIIGSHRSQAPLKGTCEWLSMERVL